MARIAKLASDDWDPRLRDAVRPVAFQTAASIAAWGQEKVQVR